MIRFLLASLLLLPLGPQAQAKLIEPETLLAKILESYRAVYQFYAEAKVTVYDPEAFRLLEEETGNDIPYVLSDRAYGQRLIFMRDEFLFIETKGAAGELLHLYFREGEKIFSRNVRQDRRFHTEDIVFPHTVFFTKFPSLLKAGLSELGIALLDVKLKRHGSGYLYQLGTDEENIRVDQEDFRVLEANRTVAIGGRVHNLKILFRNWDGRKKRIPGLMRYYIGDRLLKDVRLTKIDIRGNRSRGRDFVKKYRHFLPPPSFSAIANYAR